MDTANIVVSYLGAWDLESCLRVWGVGLVQGKLRKPVAQGLV